LRQLYVRVSLEEHIKIHKFWYDEFGSSFDALAYKRMSYMIGKEEHIRQVLSEAGKIGGRIGKPTWSNEDRIRQSKSMSGANNPYFGKTHSTVVRKKLSDAAKLRVGAQNPFYGKNHSTKTIQKIHFKVTCPHCGKIGNNAPMKLWHFDKCKSLGENIAK